jgi:hypothetical protein
MIILLPCGALAPEFQKSRPGLGSLYTYGGDREQVGHHLWLLHGNLLHNLDVSNPVTESIDHLNILDVRDSVLGIAKAFHVVLETFIMLLPEGL